MSGTGHAAVVPPIASLRLLMAKVTRQYEAALKAKAVFFYPSTITVVAQDLAGVSSGAFSSTTTTVPWTVRCVPALLDKAKEKSKKDKNGSSNDAQPSPPRDAEQQNADDVFAPPYHPNLLVEELPQHTVLLNKFCVVPKHFLLVTRDFQPQSMPPAPDMLAIAYRILSVHRQASEQKDSTDATYDKELLAFYNCGQASGASQPHQHMQFAELGSESEQTCKGADGDAIPIERLLKTVPQDGKEDDVFALPLPHQHFISLIKQPPIDDDQKLQRYLGNKLMSLLDSLFQARITAATAGNESQSHSQRPAAPSWNLLLTTRAMHLIPRQREEFEGLQELVKEEGAVHVEDGVELVGALSVNSLGYAGHLLVKSTTELDYLRRVDGGVTTVLRRTGTAPVVDFTVSHEAVRTSGE